MIWYNISIPRCTNKQQFSQFCYFIVPSVSDTAAGLVARNPTDPAIPLLAPDLLRSRLYVTQRIFDKAKGVLLGCWLCFMPESRSRSLKGVASKYTLVV